MSNDLSLSTKLLISMCLTVAIIIITVTAALLVKKSVTGTIYNQDYILKIQTTLGE